MHDHWKKKKPLYRIIEGKTQEKFKKRKEVKQSKM